MNSDSLTDALTSALRSAGKSWRQAKRQADRNDRVRSSDLHRLRHHSRDAYFTEAVEVVMPQAYLKVSGNKKLPGNARQIMYAVRPGVLKLTGGKCWKDSSYFTQKLLPTYMENHATLTADWDVIYDARGHLHEPHEGESLGLGTLEVRDYIHKWDRGKVAMSALQDVITIPSRHRFKNVLFLEKEGFHPLLRQAQIAERYDIGIMSTKGMTVTACRSLIDHFAEVGVRVFVAHDFDKSGLGILHTMFTDSARYTYRNKPDVVELGLRLADVEEMKLDAEPVNYDSDPTPCLRKYGCTAAEIKFLHSSYRTGQRVELNAMTSPQFIEWLERKFAEHGVKKFVPDADTLHAAYVEACKHVAVTDAVDEALEAFDADAIKVPGALDKKLRKRITGTADSWEKALIELAREEMEGA